MALIGVLLLVGAAVAIPGGWENADINDETVQSIAKLAADELAARSNSMYKSRLLNVIKAETQVVAGINYRITLKLGHLNCRQNDDTDPAKCQVQKVQKCSVTMWVRPWLNENQLTHFQCQEMENVENEVPRLVVGGEQPVDLTELPAKQAVEFVVGHFTSTSDGMYTVNIQRLVEGSKQVVAGMLYRLHLELVLSSCEKSTDGTSAPVKQCANNLHTNVIKCYVEVLDQAWMNPRHTLHTHRCQPVTDSSDTLFFEPSNKIIGGDHDVGMLGEFEKFKQKYDKHYSTVEEEKKRYQIFLGNMKIAKLMQHYDQGTATFGASPFADLTAEEFRTSYLSRNWDLSPDSRLKPAKIPTEAPSDAYDWRDHGAVTPVKNQGTCGSCWAFSVTGNIEGQWKIKKQKLISLSEQELVDCDKLDEGCNGGLPANAYEEIQRLGGLESETDYPYKGEDERCNFEKQEVRVYINGSVNVSKNEDEIKGWVYKHGPVSIGINAFAMQFYLGGISHPWKIFCAPDFLDHGVAIVGYAVHKGFFSNTPYWIIKNSWGAHWGDKGYYLVYRGAGVCGLNQMVSSAVVD